MDKNVVQMPFGSIATYNPNTIPKVQIKPEVLEWCQGNDGFRYYNVLMGPIVQEAIYEVTFSNSADALLFKLTFGGA